MAHFLIGLFLFLLLNFKSFFFFFFVFWITIFYQIWHLQILSPGLVYGLSSHSVNDLIIYRTYVLLCLLPHWAIGFL